MIQCRVLGVSKSGFYAWRSRLKSKRKIDDERILKQLEHCFKDSKRTYGVLRLTADLQALGEPINHKRVARLKRENNIYPKQHKKFVVTTDSKHGKVVASNILDRKFAVSAPNKVWVSDITYIATAQGWVYLAVVIDLFSRMVIGWQLGNHMRAELVCEAVQNAQVRRDCLPKLFHSDRGSQYVSEAMEEQLRGVVISMSRKGNCWDNAVAESFFGTLKTEHIEHEKFETIQEVRMSLFQYIEGFYNRKRRHSYLGNISPAIFEAEAA